MVNSDDDTKEENNDENSEDAMSKVKSFLSASISYFAWFILVVYIFGTYSLYISKISCSLFNSEIPLDVSSDGQPNNMSKEQQCKINTIKQTDKWHGLSGLWGFNMFSEPLKECSQTIEFDPIKHFSFFELIPSINFNKNIQEKFEKLTNLDNVKPPDKTDIISMITNWIWSWFKQKEDPAMTFVQYSDTFFDIIGQVLYNLVFTTCLNKLPDSAIRIIGGNFLWLIWLLYVVCFFWVSIWVGLKTTYLSIFKDKFEHSFLGVKTTWNFIKHVWFSGVFAFCYATYYLFILPFKQSFKYKKSNDSCNDPSIEIDNKPHGFWYFLWGSSEFFDFSKTPLYYNKTLTLLLFSIISVINSFAYLGMPAGIVSLVIFIGNFLMNGFVSNPDLYYSAENIDTQSATNLSSNNQSGGKRHPLITKYNFSLI